ncbi:hypothetical protein AJ85_07905 [Alkalihalobacillus alcalophilus ATCC 27647 = CGMCC 1.3604]|uniref:CBS domain-containing protein n=1 Tax=Alkalihalobacillus alcalophilus ATCC 27647 = CGMCC 1.3604 TaxID=1218173 RepID=A0A094WG23_ALKAL|nr:DUF294 nucleotidyltransferase-like domain-containing protein [Alkalihalobacillus alcalophilus]KGA95721.1 hypothetical protein BALCAV_0220730 [Alkalihalobacillus alcalophilus ATCC 27647 = CGMCC 1.3604]MED1564037.1 DUF294 nucleotidyltransferase-like domain-containing protein [Alkalihalobacillus alcalophilus]THG90962.1 hypothetical protein AJ85_07905 [Alkalihalobacillus alcalophilus ATCC 27647 = CGMCC 1.3604]
MSGKNGRFADLNEGFYLDKLEAIYQKRIDMLNSVEPTVETVLEVHEQIMDETVKLVLEKVESEWGSPPTHFAFFLLGSGGRGEQLYWSDQDHGLVYAGDRNDEHEQYFLGLGQEIVTALEKVGYQKCDGKVMASYKRWCKSSEEWQAQLLHWMQNDKWENIRHTLTFFDATTFIGDELLLQDLKDVIFQEMDHNPTLVQRFIDNTGRVKKGIGFFGQFLVETKGKNQGKLDLKQIALFPFVNGLRLLALNEEIQAAPTLERFQKLSPFYKEVKEFEGDFYHLLNHQLKWQKGVKSYGSIHYLDLGHLSNKEKKDLKKWIRRGHQLYGKIRTLLEEG